MTTNRAVELHTVGSHEPPLEPWYRQGWPWFLLSIPLTSVVLGFVMLYLGLNTNHSLVVDDYYKQGKGINVRIERDWTASLLGLSATIQRGNEGLSLVLSNESVSAPDGLADPGERLRAAFVEPARIRLRFVHATQASRDFEVLFDAVGNGQYTGDGARFPHEGRWRVHIEPFEQRPGDGVSPTSTTIELNSRSGTRTLRSDDWRLVGVSAQFGSSDRIVVRARAAEQLIAPSMFAPGHAKAVP